MNRILLIFLLPLLAMPCARAEGPTYTPWPLPCEIIYVHPKVVPTTDPVTTLNEVAKDWDTRICAAKVESALAVRVERSKQQSHWEWLVDKIVITMEGGTKEIGFDVAVADRKGRSVPPSMPGLDLGWLAKAPKPQPIHYRNVDCLLYVLGDDFAILDKETRVPLAATNVGAILIYKPLDPGADLSMPDPVRKRLAEYREYIKKQNNYGAMPKLQ